MKDDFEQGIRDALRRADFVAIPVRPLDPDDVAALASDGPRAKLKSRTARRLLAMAASVVLVAGVGLAAWSWLGRSTAIPAAPSAGTEFMVEVDLYSGRENPELQLSPSVGRELYLMLEDITAGGLLKPSDPPEFGLELRGFVVTPSDPSLPVLRIVPKRVYLVRAGSYEQYFDTDENFYNRVYHALASQLPEGVPEAPPTTTPVVPTLTAAMPPSLGDAATWTLAEPNAVSAVSATLTLNVTRLGCSGGKTGDVLKPTFSTSDTQIIIRANVKPRSRSGFAACPSNDAAQVTLQLDGPVGDRVLLDAACLEGDAVGTSSCATGASRWTP